MDPIFKDEYTEFDRDLNTVQRMSLVIMSKKILFMISTPLYWYFLALITKN